MTKKPWSTPEVRIVPPEEAERVFGRDPESNRVVDYDDRFPLLDALLCGKRLWNIKAPLAVRIHKLRELHAGLAAEHSLIDEVNDIDIGVLLGALNLVTGLLEGIGTKKTTD